VRQYSIEARSLAEHASTKRSEIENPWNGSLGISSAIGVPIAMRETFSDVPGMSASSMFSSRVSA
jgi:hypothetical protein